MSSDTLHITVESTAEFFDAARSDLRRLTGGEDISDEYVLSLPDEAALERVLRAKNLELIRTIARSGPESMRELARLVDRDPKNVSTALHRLADLGLVRFEEHGRAKRPVVWYEDIAIDIPVVGVDADETIPA
ncbi:MarR family transcriptional regulator [Haloglomus salinum]|uniref:HVO_A0114 family putative DNA-binding protein n=1 Tax=Haloglomus salinum TaxID=2962673 RepID=UPI0020C9D433|nr:MarR family transcriptional regulator [Haloglomus salinum]